MDPPDPIPNSEVKRHHADGSVGLPNVRVGHRQTIKYRPRPKGWGFFIACYIAIITIIVIVCREND